jgi:geranylgeranyl diphosphate synthase type I
LRAIDVTSPGGGGAADVDLAVEPLRAGFEIWRTGIRNRALVHVAEFVETRCLPELDHAGVDIAADVLVQFVDGGKCLRSTFMYLGWLCGADHSDVALRAAAGLELLHAFALLQDDVMDDSPLRRGRALR